ncbi:hypothetical protein LTR32_003760 [Rachicladosporium monterosium]|uniref:Uncharacterized protein n=1 Tax=Rachicladosporium monterosium TaxID=1507873 RepID=A0ABR0L6K2_9PEZI|nr:hypothetical protein LTR32_003760 [Rachicladosporium monterosium]
MPLRQIFLGHQSPGALVSPFLWERIPRLPISNWRQSTVAIVKIKFASHISCFEATEGDEDAEKLDDTIKVMTKQRNHKTQTVNRVYANQTGASFGNVWDG